MDRDQFAADEPDDEVGASDLAFEARTDDGRRLTSMLSSICLATKQRDATLDAPGVDTGVAASDLADGDDIAMI